MRRKSSGPLLFRLLFFALLAGQPAFSGMNVWTPTGLRGNLSAFAVDPSNPSTLYAALWDGGTFKSADSGKAWIRIEGLDQAGIVKALAVHPSNPGYVIAAGTQVLSTSRDGGKAWNHVNTYGWTSAGAPIPVAIQFSVANPDTIYFLHDHGILKSANGGSTWGEIARAIHKCNLWGCSISALAIDPRNPNVLYASDTASGVWKSTNGGGTWIAQIAGSSTLRVISLAINPNDPNILFAGTFDGGILKTSDGGSNWIPLVENDTRYGRTLAIDPNYPNTLYTGGNSFVYRSADGGATWGGMIAGLSWLNSVRALVINPKDPAMLYAATSLGLYEYTNLGRTLYFPHLLSRNATTIKPDDSEYTGIGIVNMDSADATLTFTAYDREGHLISGDGIANPALRTLKAGAQLPIIDFEVWGPGLAAVKPIGWFKVDSTTAKVAGLFLMFNGSLSILDGADATYDLPDNNPILLTDIQTDGFMQINVVNPNAETADVNVELIDPNGTSLARAVRSVNPAGALIEDLATLFPGLTYSSKHYLNVWSDYHVIPFAYMGKTAKLVQALNWQLPNWNSTTLYCPQYVVGGSDWRTALSIVNPANSEAAAMLRFFRDDGTQMGNTRTFTIPRSGKVYINDPDFFVTAGSSLVQGYVEITNVGPFRGPLAGNVTFGDPARSVFGAALPLVHTPLSDFVFSQVASNATWFTGVAVLNPDYSAANATVYLLDKTGSVMRAKTLVIPARSRISKLLTQPELFPDIVGVNISSGYIRVTSDKGLAAFALFGPNDLSALTAVPPQSIK